MLLPGCDAILDFSIGVTRARYASAIYVSYIYGQQSVSAALHSYFKKGCPSETYIKP